MPKQTAIIAGAGPAGLTAAFELLERTDIVPQVFEATDMIGGIAQTYVYKGNRIDIGGHRFFSKNDRVMRWWFDRMPLEKGTGGPDIDRLEAAVSEWTADDTDDVMLRRHRVSHILYRRQLFNYPLSITLRAGWNLGIWNTLMITLSYLKARALPLKDETYLDAFFTNRFGRRLYLTFFKDYTEKVWGLPCEKIKADWGAQRIKGLSLRRAVAHALKDLLSSDFQKAQAARETSLITQFYYPKLGPGHMWEVVADEVKQKGGNVTMDTAVTAVHHNGKRITGITTTDRHTGEDIRHDCDYFFSTMPIKHLIAMMDPLPPEDVVRVASHLQYRDFLTVGLLLKKLHVHTKGTPLQETVNDTWMYIQERDVRVGRVQFFNNWSPYLVADPETQWIGLEYFVQEGDDLWSMSDGKLITMGQAELEKVRLIKASDVLDGCVLRMPKAYPTYTGTYDELQTVRDYVNGFDNLYLLGRNGQHRYNNQDHSMLTSMLAVDGIVTGKVDKTAIWSVNAEQEYHEEKADESA